MREIKFRAWSKTYNAMYLALTAIIIDGEPTYCSFISDLGDEETIPIGELKLMQFTGLANIFEGDIVVVSGSDYYSNDSFNTEDGESWTFTGEVVMNSYMWMVVDKGSGCYIPFCDILNDELDIEVIGNIYENPELLTDGK